MDKNESLLTDLVPLIQLLHQGESGKSAGRSQAQQVYCRRRPSTFWNRFSHRKVKQLRREWTSRSSSNTLKMCVSGFNVRFTASASRPQCQRRVTRWHKAHEFRSPWTGSHFPTSKVLPRRTGRGPGPPDSRALRPTFSPRAGCSPTSRRSIRCVRDERHGRQTGRTSNPCTRCRWCVPLKERRKWIRMAVKEGVHQRRHKIEVFWYLIFLVEIE